MGAATYYWDFPGDSTGNLDIHTKKTSAHMITLFLHIAFMHVLEGGKWWYRGHTYTWPLIVNGIGDQNYGNQPQMLTQYEN